MFQADERWSPGGSNISQGSKGREPSEKRAEMYLGNIRNGIEGQQKLSRSVQAKEVQYGEYPKYMLKNSLTD